jgi:transcriptional regulator with XRE-family HTH domain
MDTKSKLLAAIRNRRGNLSKLAKASGLTVEGLRKIADGRTLNPGVETLKRLEKALLELAEDTAPPSAAAEASIRGAKNHVV